MKTIGIIGAGVMGPQLAALFAGCGSNVLLFGRKGKKAKPVALFTSSDIARVAAVDIDADALRLGECDWVVECIAERLETKKKLYADIASYIGGDAILTSNTSGLSLKHLVDGMDADLARRFFITHFFYPPRHMKLVEIVTSADVDPAAVIAISSFLVGATGKGIVRAKDTPNFIANRIGVQYVMDAMHAVFEHGWPVEAVDTVMGPATGRPTTGIFRMSDLVGIDTVAAVAGTQRYSIPQYMQQMIARGWTGNKGGQGFYKREGTRRLVIDPARMQYRPRLRFEPRSIAMVTNEQDVAKRMRHIAMAKDPGGEIAWRLLSNSIVYAAEVADEIADDIASIDRAMRWGFGWHVGPFETWDALGVRETCGRLAEEGREVPRKVRDLLASGRERFYDTNADRVAFFDVGKNILMQRRAGQLVDIGDGVVLLKLSGSLGLIDRGVVDLISEALGKVEDEASALVVTGEGSRSHGMSDLRELLSNARLKKWREIDAMLTEYQNLSRRIRHANVPVVFALEGSASGIAAEFAIAAARRQAWVESPVWINHLLLGLIPGAGGCLSVLRRYGDAAKVGGGPHPKVKRAFEAIGGALRVGSAIDAKKQGLFAPKDGVTMDRDRLADDAKVCALKAAASYAPPSEEGIELPGRGGEMALLGDMRSYARLGVLSADDAIVCKHLAHILSGGNRPTVHVATEEDVFDLEREAYLSLVGTAMTQHRIEHFIKTGKYLR